MVRFKMNLAMRFCKIVGNASDGSENDFIAKIVRHKVSGEICDDCDQRVSPSVNFISLMLLRFGQIRQRVISQRLFAHPLRFASSSSTVDLSTCSGCGSAFQEETPHRPGYLPQMEHRKQAFVLGVSFEHYKRHFLSETPAQAEYERKRLLMQNIMVQASEQVDASSVKDDQNASAIIKDAASSSTSSLTELPSNHVLRLVCDRCKKLGTNQVEHLRQTVTQKSAAEPSPLVQWEHGNLMKSQEALKKIEEEILAKKNALVIALCDITDFPLSLNVPWIQRLSGHIPVIIAANKFDLLTIKPNVERLNYWLKDYVHQRLGLKQVADTCLVSVKTNFGMQKLMESVVRLRGPTDDVYLVGQVNVGKSSLINAWSKSFQGPTDRESTTSWVPGTTMDSIRIPLQKLKTLRNFVVDYKHDLVSQKQMPQRNERPSLHALRSSRSSDVSKLLTGSLVDTPGYLDMNSSLLPLLTNQEMKYVIWNKPVVSWTYFLRPGRSIWFGGLGRLDYVEGDAQVLVTLFFSSKLPVHESQIAKSKTLWEKHGGARSINWTEKLVCLSLLLMFAHINIGRLCTTNCSLLLKTNPRISNSLMTERKRCIVISDHQNAATSIRICTQVHSFTRPSFHRQRSTWITKAVLKKIMVY